MGAGHIELTDMEIDVENIGGIEETSVVFSHGVTILTGRNATNRTSLLQALVAALGSEHVSLKSDADTGFVELSTGEGTYDRTLTRQGDTVSTQGNPYLQDPTLADLFAFLLESNRARRAVARNDDLRTIIMEPVDTEEIQAAIDRLVSRREQLTAELEEIDSRAADLPGLEEERSRLEEDIEVKKHQLAEVEAELKGLDADVETRREEQSTVEQKLAELQEKRARLDDVRYDLETEQESLEHLREERRDRTTEKEALPDSPAGELDEIEADLDSLRARTQEVEAQINELQSVIGFNEEMLDGVDVGPLAVLSAEDTRSDSVTDTLVDDTRFECWTCGSTVERTEIQATVDQLRDLSQEKLDQLRDLEDQIDHRKAQGDDLREQHRRRDELAKTLEQLKTQIHESEANIERLRSRKEDLTEEIVSIESDIADLETEANDKILDLHRTANQLEYELGKLETERDRVNDAIAAIEARLDDRDEVAANRSDVSADIEELRTKIDRIEREAVQKFNEHMDTVLELLDYGNLERVWLERKEPNSNSVQHGNTSVFELHVVRRTTGGTTYEDTIDHLSESEREVTGLVFGLAGYLAHDVHEAVPFVLLDSVEAIDAKRISTLVDYFADYSDYLVVALLPEDASALDDDYVRITDI